MHYSKEQRVCMSWSTFLWLKSLFNMSVEESNTILPSHSQSLAQFYIWVACAQWSKGAISSKSWINICKNYLNVFKTGCYDSCFLYNRVGVNLCTYLCLCAPVCISLQFWVIISKVGFQFIPWSSLSEIQQFEHVPSDEQSLFYALIFMMIGWINQTTGTVN